jgi:hypothetical protein
MRQKFETTEFTLNLNFVFNYSVAKKEKKKKQNYLTAGCRWLTPVILATQEAEIRRIILRSQPEQIVCKTLS